MFICVSMRSSLPCGPAMSMPIVIDIVLRSIRRSARRTSILPLPVAVIEPFTSAGADAAGAGGVASVALEAAAEVAAADAGADTGSATSMAIVTATSNDATPWRTPVRV